MVFYLINAILKMRKMRKTKTNEMLVWRECWRLMFMTGQNHFPPRRMKRYSPIKKTWGDNSSISLRKRFVRKKIWHCHVANTKQPRSYGNKIIRRGTSIKNTQILGCPQDRSWGLGGVVNRDIWSLGSGSKKLSNKL